MRRSRGGGGLIHLLGPNAGSIACTSSACNIAGGAAAGTGPDATLAGGGASAGNGGASFALESQPDSAGSLFLTTVVDPATLFN